MSGILLGGLWQGAFITAIAALATALLPQRHAASRYAVWFVAVLALAIVPALSVWHPAPALAPLPASVVHAASAATQGTQRAANAGGSWLLFVWLLGVAFGLFRLTLSYLRIRQVVRGATPAPELGPGVTISDDVSLPIAAGFFTPSIVIPADLVETLERDDLASIVRHERAHIARGDGAGNLVQRLVEALLFFNPWVYAIGRQLIKEREAACDDWAVHPMRDPDRYASCLTQLAQGARRSRTLLLTPSAIGSRHLLVGRIARLLNGKATSLKVNYAVLGASVISFATLAFILQTSSGLAAPAGSLSNALADSSCSFPHGYHDVTVRNAVEPNILKSDYRPGLSADALVTVGSNGRPLSAKIVKSSGSAGIDRATTDAAMRSTYSPETHACKPVTGTYLFHVETGR